MSRRKWKRVVRQHQRVDQFLVVVGRGSLKEAMAMAHASRLASEDEFGRCWTYLVAYEGNGRWAVVVTRKSRSRRFEMFETFDDLKNISGRRERVS